MRALTIRQPWASLIVYGSKRIENRTRRPPDQLMGQFIGIHAGKTVDDAARPPRQPAMSMPRGALLGYARITGVVLASEDLWFMGPIGIQLDDVSAYPRPIPMRGNQGYWPVLARLSRVQREDWEERAAIQAHDGGMEEDDAEWEALYHVLRGRG